MKHLSGYGFALVFIAVLWPFSPMTRAIENRDLRALLAYVIVVTMTTGIWLIAEGLSRPEAKKPEEEKKADE